MAHAFALWGITSVNVGDLDGLGAVDVLERLGWEATSRARMLIITAQRAEIAGHTWTEIAALIETTDAAHECRIEADR